MSAQRVGRVTCAGLAFALSVEAWGQSAQPTELGTERGAPPAFPSAASRSAPEDSPPPESSPAPLVESEPILPSTVSVPATRPPPEPQVKPEVARPPRAPPPAASTSYPRKWLKPHRIAPHYGPISNFHWDVTGYATGGVNPGLNDTAGGYAFGVRSNVDIGFFAIFAQYERFIAGQRGYSTNLHQGKLMVGFIPLTTPYGRLRILTGFDIMSQYLSGATLSKVTVSPAIAISGRLGNGIFGLEAAGLIGMYPMFQAEARVAFVVRFAIVQLHLGYQMVYRASAPGTAPGVSSFVGNATEEFLNGIFLHGPQAGVGFGW